MSAPSLDKSDQTLKLIEASRPANGSLLAPGATDAWELKYYFGETYAAELGCTVRLRLCRREG